MNFYDLDPPAQQKAATARLLRYLREYVAPYHPYLRKAYRESGFDPRKLRTIEDFQRLPIIDKKQLQNDPLMFILRVNSAEGPALPPGYDCEPLRKGDLLRYALKAAAFAPFDPAYLVRRNSFRERIRRAGMLEWLPIHTHLSSGSSGNPTPVTFSHSDIHRNIGEMAALLIQPKKPRPGYLPFDWGERKMSIFPGAPHVAFYAPLMAKLLVGSPSFETFGGAVIPTEKQISIFVSGGFQTLLAIPSYLVHWLRKAIALRAQNKVGPLRNLKRVILGAEPVSEPLRNYIRQLAIEAGAEPGMRILQTAGMTEMKWTFLECSEGSGIHLNPKYYYWELLHPETRKPVGPREPGVLVFTHIGWHGTVLVRYWTGDLIKGGMIWDRCEICGWTFPRIFPPICRAEQDFTKIKGTRVDLSLLVEVVRDTPGVRQFQISLENADDGQEFGRDLLVIRVASERGSSSQELEQRLRERVKSFTEVSPDRITVDDDETALDQLLFAKNGFKAQYLVERRSHHV